MSPQEEIREIWAEMKEMKWKEQEPRLQELRDKFEEIEILFGHESTLDKAIIYYLNKK